MKHPLDSDWFPIHRYAIALVDLLQIRPAIERVVHRLNELLARSPSG